MICCCPYLDIGIEIEEPSSNDIIAHISGEVIISNDIRKKKQSSIKNQFIDEWCDNSFHLFGRDNNLFTRLSDSDNYTTSILFGLRHLPTNRFVPFKRLRLLVNDNIVLLDMNTSLMTKNNEENNNIYLYTLNNSKINIRRFSVPKWEVQLFNDIINIKEYQMHIFTRCWKSIDFKVL